MSTESHKLYAYITGFGLSLLITVTAYAVVVHGSLSYHTAIAAISVLALLQFVAQLVFFLRIGNDTRPRWKLFVLGFMVLVLIIIVGGSLWIMNNLNYRMTPDQIDQYLSSQDGL